MVAIGLSDGRTVVHNIEFDETLMTFRQESGAVTAICFRTGQQLYLLSLFRQLSAFLSQYKCNVCLQVFPLDLGEMARPT